MAITNRPPAFPNSNGQMTNNYDSWDLEHNTSSRTQQWHVLFETETDVGWVSVCRLFITDKNMTNSLFKALDTISPQNRLGLSNEATNIFNKFRLLPAIFTIEQLENFVGTLLLVSDDFPHWSALHKELTNWINNLKLLQQPSRVVLIWES